jgi:hypothetical protein
MTRDAELCEGATYHSPLPLFTERHHVYPMYLAALLGVPANATVVPLCGTEHENVHHALRHLINTGENPHRFADRTRGYVDHLVTICWHHHLDGWATSHREELRIWIRTRNEAAFG